MSQDAYKNPSHFWLNPALTHALTQIYEESVLEDLYADYSQGVRAAVDVCM